MAHFLIAIQPLAKSEVKMPYQAPVSEFTFMLDHIVGFDRIATQEIFADCTPDTVAAILFEAAKLANETMAPLNRISDKNPARLENGIVRTSLGFAQAYGQIASGGWVGMAGAPEYGGMGLPMAVVTCVNEMMSAACLSLALNPLMAQGQIEALEHHASEAIKALAVWDRPETQPATWDPSVSGPWPPPSWPPTWPVPLQGPAPEDAHEDARPIVVFMSSGQPILCDTNPCLCFAGSICHNSLMPIP
jgi:hypothetical protein